MTDTSEEDSFISEGIDSRNWKEKEGGDAGGLVREPGDCRSTRIRLSLPSFVLSCKRDEFKKLMVD